LSDKNLEELIAFADWRVQFYQATNTLPESCSALDFVNDALVKAIEGKRKYDPARGEFVPWLKSQIRSLISNARERYRRHPESRYPDSEDSEFIEGKLTVRAAEGEIFGDSVGINPEDVVIAQEEEKKAEEFVDVLCQNIQREPELEQIIDALLNGCEHKTRFIADELGISPQEARNRVNRLRRRALRLREGR